MSAWPIKQHVDDYHGHIVLHYEGSTQPIALLVDCGDTVHIDYPAGRHEPFTEHEAREIGAALIGWAGRKRLARKESA